MSSSIKYSLARNIDLENISSFSHVSVQDYSEEFFSTEMKGSLLAIATVNDTVLGVEGYMAYKVIWGGELHTSHRSERTLVSPELRGKGVFQALVNLCAENSKKINSQLCWGSTPVLSAFKGAGFITFSKYRSYIMLPLYPQGVMSLRYFKNLLRNGISSFLNGIRLRDLATLKECMALVSCICSPFGRTLTDSNLGLEHKDEPYFYEEIDRLHQKIPNASNTIFLSHSKALYEWVSRRVRQRGGNLFLVCSYKDATLVSYVLVYIRKDSAVAEVIDFCYLEYDYFVSTLSYVKGKVREYGVVSLFIALNVKNAFQKSLGDLLSSYSVVRVVGLGHWVVRPEGNNDEELYRDIDRWYLTDLWTIW